MQPMLFLLGAAFAAAAAAERVATTSEDAVKIVADYTSEAKHPLRIAIFAPQLANSQVIWNKRVGEELMRAGHDVTIYMMMMYEIFENRNRSKNKSYDFTLVPVNGSTGFDGERLRRDQSEYAFHDLPFWDSRPRKTMGRFIEMMPKSCKLFIKNNEFISHIEDSKYDIAFTHMYNFCPIGIIHHTKIPTWVWLISGALMDQAAELMGVPVPRPGNDGCWREHDILRASEIICRSCSIQAHLEKAPLVMVNSNELYDLARPTLSKIVNIGGIGIKSKDAKTLDSEFASRVEKAKGVVVMSFGSIAPMYLMPEHWKEAYFKAFAQFQDIQFFLRYERPEEIADILPPNAYAAKWLPQTDLLLHPKTLGLISHGGYNSVQDVLHAGVPIMATGLYGDQPKNAHLVERLGMGINLHKSKINVENVVNALRRLMEDKSLKINAQRIKTMIATKPVSAETLLVRWTEFIAQHKKLENLIPYGNSLSFFVYHSLDVLLFLYAIFMILAALLSFFIRYALICCGICKSCRNGCNINKKKTQ